MMQQKTRHRVPDEGANVHLIDSPPHSFLSRHKWTGNLEFYVQINLRRPPPPDRTSFNCILFDMDSQIVLHTAFDPSSVKFSQISKTSKGGKIVYMNFPNNQRITLQIPTMSAPFGISSYDDESNGRRSYSIDASFRGMESNAKLSSFLTKCRAFDDRLLDVATENSKAWFGMDMSKETIAVLFRKSIREAADPTKYAPTLRLKITPNTEFYDEHQNKVGMDYIVKGTSFRAIVELSSVFFVNKQFGVTWRIVQLAVTTRPDRLTGFSFMNDGEEDGDADGM